MTLDELLAALQAARSDDAAGAAPVLVVAPRQVGEEVYAAYDVARLLHYRRGHPDSPRRVVALRTTTTDAIPADEVEAFLAAL
jgi:hypothetical protein